MTDVQFQRYEVVPNDPKAVLIIVHGIAEHGGRYCHVAEALACEHIACLLYDQRGHGASPGTRTHIDDFTWFADDLECIGEAAAKRFPGLPLFVWGHSMGSVVVMLAAIDGLKWARGIITSGCALDALPKLDGLVGGALKLGTALLPRLRISLRIDARTLTQVPEVQQRHMSDPLVPRTASLQLLYGFALACRKCRSQAPKITLPWLAVHGEADAVCPVSGSRALISAIASQDKRLVTYPGLLHEIHNEDDGARTVFFELMTCWILERAKGYTVPGIL